MSLNFSNQLNQYIHAEASPALPSMMVPQSHLPVINSESSHSYHIYNDHILNNSLTEIELSQQREQSHVQFQNMQGNYAKDYGVKFLYSLTNHVTIIEYMDRLEEEYQIKDIKGAMKSVIIFDKRKISLLNNQIPAQITRNDSIIMLNFFHIETQEIEFVKLLCIPDPITVIPHIKDLSDFIQRNFNHLLRDFKSDSNVKQIIHDFQAQTIILCNEDMELFKFYEWIQTENGSSDDLQTMDYDYHKYNHNRRGLQPRLLNDDLISIPQFAATNGGSNNKLCISN